MVTTLSLQATVRFSPMPEILRLPPGGGAGDVDGAVVDGADAVGVGGLLRVVDGTVLRGRLVDGLKVAEMLGAVVDETLESRCATKAAMPPARARKPRTMTVPTIHQMRLFDGGFGGGPENPGP
jgi:hypothetical protein